MASKLLNDKQIKNAQPKEKAYKLNDGDGLYLFVTPSGGKSFRFNYTKNGKQKTITFGLYPVITLSLARDLLIEAKRANREGDAAEEKRKEKQTEILKGDNTFRFIAELWVKDFLSKKSESTQRKVKSRLSRFTYPKIGHRPIHLVTSADILQLTEYVIKNSTLDVALRVKQEASQIIKSAKNKNFIDFDVTASLRNAFPSVKQKNFASPAQDLNKTGALLRTIWTYCGSIQVKTALRLAPYLFARPGELRQMKWSEINFNEKLWKYDASKGAGPHIVPLSRQALELLEEIKPHTFENRGGYVFTGARSVMRPMSDNAMNAALKSLEIDTQEELTGHGWRSVARTQLSEEYDIDSKFIERQLSHKTTEANGTAYDRAKYLKKRIPMMQTWADHLDKLRENKELQG
ncbi:MAG: tyrosine-type recombinase/integrase [Gallionellaceae bacterium]|nr:tyrosine-type recombinase/integrase [Gallionellaceae bacterium]